MVSPEAMKLNNDLREASSAPAPEQPPSLAEIRAFVETMASQGTTRNDVSVSEVDMGGRRALKHVPENKGERVILHLHGGGLSLGSPESHTTLAAHLAAHSGMTVYNLDYRLAPEHPFPAALDDTAAAFQWLIDEGIPAEHVFLSGDSGGAALVLTTLIELTQAGHRLAGGILMSPWADLTLTSSYFDINAKTDFACSRPMMLPLRDNYSPSGDFENPRVSPGATGDLSGLPPLIIQTSAQEVLVGDAKLIADRASKAGTDVTYQEYEVVPHVFQAYAGNLPEADAALKEIATWAKRQR